MSDIAIARRFARFSCDVPQFPVAVRRVADRAMFDMASIPPMAAGVKPGQTFTGRIENQGETRK